MIIQLANQYESKYGLPVISFVDTEIFTMKYPVEDCMEMGCKDICCSGGAIMDSIHFEKVRKMIHDKLPVNIDWDSFVMEQDPYYPGGMGCYTRFDNNKCMFQREGGNGCMIHAYCLEQKIDFREFKFFACCLFPCEVNTVQTYENVLTPGYELRFPGFDLPCKKGGGTSVYEKAKDEIIYYFGETIIEELEKLKKSTLCLMKG